MKLDSFSQRFTTLFMVACLLGMGWSASPASATDVKNQYWRVELWTDQEVAQPGGAVRYYMRITRLGPPVPEAIFEFRAHREFRGLDGFSTPPDSLTMSNTGWTANWRYRGGSKQPQLTFAVTFLANLFSSTPLNIDVSSQGGAFFPNTTEVINTVTTGGSLNLTNGATPNAGNSDEPVQLATGEYYTDPIVDINLGGPLPLIFSRRYAARLRDEGIFAGALGENWQHNFELRINLLPSWLEVVYFGGYHIRFLPDPYVAGSWTPNNPHEVYYQVRDEPASYWFMDPLRERIFRFDKRTGQLVSIQDRNGNTLSLRYDRSKLVEVSDGLGRRLTFTYTGTNLTGVSDGTRNLVYAYTSRKLTGVTDAEGRTTTYTYDPSGTHGPLMTTRQWPAGNQPSTQTYTRDGQVSEQRDAYNHTTTFRYNMPAADQTTVTDADGSWVVTHQDRKRLMRFQDRAGKAMTFEYDESGRRTSVTNRLGDTTRMTYHQDTGKLASYTDAEGNTTRFTYTAQDQTFTNPDNGRTVTFTFYNLTRVTYADDTHPDFAYDAKGNVTSFTDRRGKVWRYTYNNRGQLLTITNPTGGAVTYTYNADGTRGSRTDSDTGVTTFAYDAFKRLITITRPDGDTGRFTYDHNDRLLTVADERAQTTTFTYDANGNQATRRNPLNQTYTYAYDLMDRLTGRTDPLGQRTAYTYDALSRLASITDRNGNTTTFSYNSRGWRTGRTDPAGHTWTTAYDDEGVPTAFTTPLGFTTAVQTDKLGRSTRLTDPVGQVVNLSYDALGRLTSATDRMDRETTYAYDAADRLVGMTRPVIGTATYTRNDLGLLTRISDQRGKLWNFDHSPMGRLASHTDPLGNRRTYAYDNRGRLQQITYPGSGTASFTYDAASNVTRIAYSGDPTLDYTYDEAGRLLTANDLRLTYDARGDIINSQGGAAAFGATRDAGRRLSTVTYDGQATVSYSYDAPGLLTRVSDSRSGAWMEFRYDADRRLVEIRRSNNVTTTYSYDPAGRLIRTQDGTRADQQYTLNAEGEPTRAMMNVPLGGGTTNYTYDEADRLTAADYGGTNRLAYSYDAAGNLVSRTGKTPLEPVGQVVNLSYDDACRINSAGYASDARGRQTTAAGRGFTYDGAARLTQVTAGGNTASFTYNGLGGLRTRTVGGTTSTYYHNYALGLSPIVAEKEGASYQRFYVYTPGGRLLYSIDAATNQVRFYHFDWVGSTLFLTDGSGVVSDSYAYDPYGNLLAHSGPSDQPFTFVGRHGVRWEPVGNLYHMRARTYDPVTARFLSRDPIWQALSAPQGLNPYQYAAQNPLRYVDPRGTTPDQANDQIDLHTYMTDPELLSQQQSYQQQQQQNMQQNIYYQAQNRPPDNPFFFPNLMQQAADAFLSAASQLQASFGNFMGQPQVASGDLPGGWWTNPDPQDLASQQPQATTQDPSQQSQGYGWFTTWGSKDLVDFEQWKIKNPDKYKDAQWNYFVTGTTPFEYYLLYGRPRPSD